MKKIVKTPKKRGRKPLKEFTYYHRIEKLILEGLHPLQAAKLSGISKDTYYKWLDTSKEFNELIENAESKLEANWVKMATVLAVQTKNVNGAVSLLERRFKERWSPKVTNELTGLNGQAIAFKVDMSGGFIPAQSLPVLPVVKEVSKIEPN